jgi:hypothetical protein
MNNTLVTALTVLLSGGITAFAQNRVMVAKMDAQNHLMEEKNHRVEEKLDHMGQDIKRLEDEQKKHNDFMQRLAKAETKIIGINHRINELGGKER